MTPSDMDVTDIVIGGLNGKIFVYWFITIA